MNIKTNAETGEVFADNKLLDLSDVRQVYNLSTQPLSWGHRGSGAAQFALAVLLKAMPSERHVAKLLHHQFKDEFIATMKGDTSFEIDVNVEDWVKRKIRERKNGK